MALLAALYAAAVFSAEGAINDRYFRASDGASLHYREAGQGRDLVLFVPGWLMPADVFDKQLEAIGQHHHVVALSPRSQGKSQLFPGRHTAALRARDLRDFLRHLQPRRVVVCGWSLGVIESLVLVHRHHPRALRGLVLIDNAIGEGPPPAGGALRELLPPDMSATAQATFMHDFARGLFREPPPQAMQEAIDRSLRRAPLAIARNLLEPWYPRETYRRVVHALRVPLWYVVTPRYAGQAELLQSARPTVQVDVFPTAGHALFVDEAATFNERLLAFVEPIFSAPGRGMNQSGRRRPISSAEPASLR